MKKKPKILFVGMLNSPHAARWIDLIADEGWDLHFFPVYNTMPHEMMRNITVYHPWIKVKPRQFIKRLLGQKKRETAPDLSGVKTRSILPLPLMRPFDNLVCHLQTGPLGESDVTAPLMFGPHTLAYLIWKLKPDLIHSMEFQHAGYTVLRAKQLLGKRKFPKWLGTNWGSDIYYYRQFPDHYQQLQRLLQNLDYYSCECERDIGLARDMGLAAPAMPVLPNTGGFNIEAIAPVREAITCSARKLIMVKGYEHFAGRALNALAAIEACKDDLTGYRVAVYTASPSVVKRAQELRLFHGIDIHVVSYLTHEQMLRYFSHARIYLGVSISDAISTSMLEAMAMGAFPIQTDTACCDEWFEDGVGGFYIPPHDIDVIAAKIRRALREDALVDQAARVNWETVRARLDHHLLRVKEVAFYQQILD